MILNSKARWTRAVAPALCLGAALFLLLPTSLADGWPYNHEYSAGFERVEALRRAFLAWDFFPTWTPFCFNGHGSPSPLIYHRLFNTTAGLLAVPLGTSAGARVALIFFAWLGAWGLYRVARRHDVRPSLAMLLAWSFIFAPYSLTDWLVRGSFAEFASMMVLPWLLDAMVRQLRGDATWAPLGLSLAAAMHAHQAIGLYVAVLPVLSTAGALLVARGRRLKVLVDALKAAALAMLLVVPWIFAVQKVGGAFRLDTLKIYVPWSQFVPWSRYVADDAFAWGQTFQGFSLELSRWVWWATLAVVLLTLLSGARVLRRLEFVVLTAIFAGAAALQFEFSRPLYESIPRAELLQFPWRLLAIATPVALLVLGMLCEAVSRRGAWGVVAFALLGWVTWHHVQLVRRATATSYPSYTTDEFNRRLRELDGPWSAAEYLPQAHATPPERTPWVSSLGCQVTKVSPEAPTHFKQIEVELQPGPACRLVFSQFDTPLLAVEGDGQRVTGSTLVTVEVPAGAKRVALRKRSLMELWVQ